MRLFVAVDPGEAIARELAKALERVRPLAPDAKWVAAQAAHVTLAFLGWVPDERASEIAEALEAAVERHGPLALRFGGAGTFGAKRRPRVLWIGISGALAELGALRLDVETALVSFGYEPERRPFSPHLTLARARDPRGDAALAASAAALATEEIGKARIEHVVLYRSDLSRAGATYTALHRAPLCGTGRARR